MSVELYVLLLCIFFFNHKPAYELRISDWISDVCSSDLSNFGPAYSRTLFESRAHVTEASYPYSILKYGLVEAVIDISWITEDETADRYQIGKAWCRERGCQSVSHSQFAV